MACKYIDEVMAAQRTPELRELTVNLIATELFRGKRARKEREGGTPTSTVGGRRVTEKLLEGRQRARTTRDVAGVPSAAAALGCIGGVYGTSFATSCSRLPEAARADAPRLGLMRQ